MNAYTASHWGIYEVAQDAAGRASLHPMPGDPDPSPIGLHQTDDSLARLRVLRPAVRRSWLEKGPGAAPELRGREPFVEVPWERALVLVAAELQRVRTAHGNTAIFGGSYGWSSAGRFHHAQSQVHRFLNAVGGYVRHMDSYSLGAGRALMPHIVAPMDDLMAQHTSWSVMAEHTGLFVAFGGVPAKNAQISAGGAGRHRVREGLHRMAARGVRFVNIGPVHDNLDTGAGAEWIQARPNTDTALMLALAWVLREEGLADRDFLARCCTGYERFEHYLSGEEDGQPKTPEWAEAITGVPAARTAALAREMAAQRTMLNISWSLQRATHGEQPFWMLVTLAAMLGQIGLPGGGFGLGYGATNLMGSPHPRLPGPTLPQGRNAVRDFIPVARIADMLLNPGAPFTYVGGRYTYPDIRLVYWAGGNPFHHHQDLNRLERAWQKPETIVVHEQYWTPAAKRADIVLPATTTLERSDIGSATKEGFLVAMRPVSAPAGEARDDYDIFAGIAARMGAADTYTEGLDSEGWLRRLYDETRQKSAGQGIDLPEYAAFQETGLISLAEHDRPVVMLEALRTDPAANPLNTPSGRIEIFSERIAGFGLPDCPGYPVWRGPAEWLGGPGVDRHPLHLLSDQPVRRLHSQLDASGYSTAGKVRGREQVFMHPEDAAARGLSDGDIVELFNDRGRCQAALCRSDAVMRGVVRLNTGAWYDPDPATGVEKHGNPNVLTLDAGASGFSQGCSAQTCLVEVSGPIADPPPVTAFDLPELLAQDR
ncbi:molybdopterin guanine dinucleotide-containing S/N-oxide reductase [Roseomonas indoligenes]|uniref:Molybdopterin guanine dinucleotide-containing S/N-oxide reductase n=1 Tax=Roseomonas indoligenes TaxID=2820811 RepID=A0A940MWJ9_9PROT|nr:molybdopterin guanine dinucleotide-containing S/N-oxide reductase [Pararoseomonas indoligenes]MBP0491806.1 molybdopterin guanine dinucleotide-containing S/N-oxide reductase [Pararoseomonas indoligenes]